MDHDGSQTRGKLRVKYIVGYLRLDSVLLTQGLIWNPSYEM